MNERIRKHGAADSGSAQAVADQRREPRRPAQGAVKIRRLQAAGAPIAARLIDVSDSGFRAAHSCTALCSGEVVEFCHWQNEGKARVVWTRVVSSGSATSVESGFMVLAEN